MLVSKDDPKWQKLMDEILSGMTEWRQEHPKATFSEIERETMRRVTEAAGAGYVVVQTQESDRIEREAPAAAEGMAKGLISVDGALVPLRHGEWAEVKTLVIGEVQPAVAEKGEQVVHTRNLSYFSRLIDAEQFAHLTLVEMHRRGIEHCCKVGAVMDGAEWEQGFVDYHCPEALRILDFPHAGQRIGEIGEAIWEEGSPQTRQWTAERLHQLKQEGQAAILVELRELNERYADLEVIAKNLGYLEKRQAQMQYPEFQSQGWPIGSGMVESGNKLVVEARLKGAGMHWERKNVNPMLGLRNIICSDRWAQDWPVIVSQLRRSAKQQQKERREAHRLAKIPVAPEVSPPLPIDTIAQPLVETLDKPPKTSKGSGPRKPPANHPWRHSPIGRARYQPS